MARILSWEQDFRFIGSEQRTDIHVTTMDEIHKWVQSGASHATSHEPIAALCGHAFRPMWSGTMLLDGDTLCPECEKRLDGTS